MAVMLSRVYDALVDAGAAEDKARAAVEELPFTKAVFAKLENDLAVIKWMLDLVVAGVASLVISARLISHE